LDEKFKAFVGYDNIIGHYKGKIKHKINVIEGAGAFIQKAYRVPITQQPEIREQVDDLLRQGLKKMYT
jgi:hypothetical protein